MDATPNAAASDQTTAADGMDTIRNANALKGSVHDTWGQWLLRSLLGNAPGMAQMTQQPFHSPGGIDKAAGGATGVVGQMVGGAAPQVEWSAKRLFDFLHKRPEVIHAEMASPATMTRVARSEGRVGGLTSTKQPLGDENRVLFEALTGQQPHPDAHTLMMLEDSSPIRGLGAGETPTHEALHAAYNLKGGAGFPAAKFWDALYSRVVAQHPDLAILRNVGVPPEEVIMAGLARNATRAARNLRGQ